MQKNREQLLEMIIDRGVVNIVPNKNLLLELLNSGRKLNVYLGVDPTATRIHLGHAVPLRRLQAFVELGHNVTFLIGDFTALIGDTSDKDGERPVLTSEEIKENFKTYKDQASKFLDFSKVTLRFNSEWLSKVNFVDVIKLTRHFSLNDFISRELIKKRLGDGKSVSLPEVLYPVMQGYDSYFMDTDIQIGASDQIFNMQAGRVLQKDLRSKESFIIENGYLPGTDGRKMSKSWGNAIWLTDSPEEVYGKVMSLKDEVMGEYLRLATSLSLEEISQKLERIERGENPMIIKRELAAQIVTEMHGKESVDVAKRYFDETVINKEAGDDAPVVVIESGVLIGELAEVLIEKKLVSSKSELRRLSDQGGISLGDTKVTTEDKVVFGGDDQRLELRLGKRRYLILTKKNAT